MNLREEINKLKDEGYSQQNAQARICQDITTKDCRYYFNIFG